MAAHVRRRDGKFYLDGKTTEFAPLILFSPRKPRFRRRCAPLKVSLWRRMSADATGIFILTGDNALLLTAFALAFSPVSPLSENDGKTTGNRLRLTRFLPVNPSFVAAFAALKVSFPGACPGKDGSLIWTKRQHPRGAYACSNVFSSCYSFVLKVRFRGAKTNLL